MTTTHNIEYTDTFAGEPNYGWLRANKVTMPDLTHYGYDGVTNYAKANKVYNRELVRKAKALVGLTGVRGRTFIHGDDIKFRPYGISTVLLIAVSEA